MTLTDIAERAKTSTEAEARARVTWEDLQKLCVAYTDAKRKYIGMQMTDESAHCTTDERVKFALDYNIAQQAFYAANDAYQSALKRYQEQQS